MSDFQSRKGSGTSCEGFLDLLPLYEGGELELESEVGLREHLASCEACREQWNVGRDAIRLRQAAWALDAGKTPDLWPGIRAELVNEGLLEGVASEPRGKLLRFPALRYAAAAAMLVGAAFVGLQFFGGNGADQPLPNGVGEVAEGTRSQVPSPAPFVDGGMASEESQPVASEKGRLRLMGPDDSSVLDEARPWGLEEAPAAGLRQRTESMQVAGWR
ncbi:MAG: zf-HC2 domain-containing protein [Planctomycetes bacterium]|nr:zf-HC2 domain-containing protein [Planctomycetota bacterium]